MSRLRDQGSNLGSVWEKLKAGITWNGDFYNQIINVTYFLISNACFAFRTGSIVSFAY